MLLDFCSNSSTVCITFSPVAASLLMQKSFYKIVLYRDKTKPSMSASPHVHIRLSSQDIFIHLTKQFCCFICRKSAVIVKGFFNSSYAYHTLYLLIPESTSIGIVKRNIHLCIYDWQFLFIHIHFSSTLEIINGPNATTFRWLAQFSSVYGDELDIQLLLLAN